MKRDQWLDKFLDSEHMTKIARKIEASYIDRVRMLQEGKIGKWSSVEDALQDFASRHGITPKELRYLQRAASERSASGEVRTDKGNMQVLEDEGLGSQAAEYMGKAKHKHTEDTGSPFVLDKNDVKPLKQKMLHKERQNHDLKNNSNTEEHNEFSATQQGSMNLMLKKIAEDFGKILEFPGPPGSPEAMAKLQEELAEYGGKTEYRIVRYAFRFTGLNDKPLTKKGEPVKATAYRFGFYKRKLAELINSDLRKQLSKELPIEEWIKVLSTIDHPDAKIIAPKLIQLQRDLFGDKPANVEVVRDRTSPKNIARVMEIFPVSYQKKILELLADAKYRHLTVEMGRSHSELWSTDYRTGSFVLMQSFSPYVKTVPQLTSAEQRTALMNALKQVVESGKKDLSSQEFTDLLQSVNIPFDQVETLDPYQQFKLGDLKINNQPNSNYQPMKNKLSESEANDSQALEEQLMDFHNHMMSVLKHDMHQLQKAEEARELGKKVKVQLTPLAYEAQPDGSYKPLSLLELQDKKDYTMQHLSHKDDTGKEVEVPNPTAGVHPSYQGKFQQPSQAKGISMPGIGNKSRWNTSIPSKPIPSKHKTPSTPSEPTSDRWKDLKDRLEKMKKFESIHNALVKLGAADLWVTDRGETYTSKEELEEALYNECIEEAHKDIIRKVVEDLFKWITQMPKDNKSQIKAPTPIQKPVTSPEVEREDEDVVDEDEKLPLAASTILRLKRLAFKLNKQG